jgi:hypothetical protein
MMQFSDQLVAELEQGRVITAARLGRDGWPRATTVGYCNEGALIYFVVPADNDAFSDLDADARVLLSIGRDSSRPASMEPDGDPIEAGICEVSDPAERAGALNLLAARYPGLGPVMTRMNHNGAQLRLMRATPFAESMLTRSANAA